MESSYKWSVRWTENPKELVRFQYFPPKININLNGISRDHIISINYGFKNNIDYKIISHPANCQLLRHSENSKKYTKCDLTLKELLNKIKKWNKKYGALI